MRALVRALVAAVADAVEEIDKQGAERREAAEDEDEPEFSIGPDDEVGDEVCFAWLESVQVWTKGE